METKFSRNIKTHLPPDKLWKDVLSGIQNSDGHPFWPTDMEESHADSLKPQGEISVNYKLVTKGKPVTYKITEVDEASRHFAYRTTADHPLEGRAEIKVYPNNSGGSTLRWEGVYNYPWYSPSGLFMRSYFLDRFFSKLSSSIHDYEKEQKSDQSQPTH